MEQLYPLAVGKNTNFFYVTTGSNGSSQFQYQDSFNVLRQESLTINNEARAAWVIERRQVGQAGNNFNGSETLWIDQQIGITLKREIGAMSGTTSSRSFTVSQINLNP
jgi:hypothetical protein